MTHAGTITVGVDIDGGNLGAELAAAVRRELAPVLAEINRDLGKTSQGLGGVDGGLRGVTREATKAAGATDTMAKAARNATKAQREQKTSAENLTDTTAKLSKAQERHNAALEIFGKDSEQALKFHRLLIRAENEHTAALIDHRVESNRSATAQIVDLDAVASAAENAGRRRIAADTNIAASAERAAKRQAAAAATSAGASATVGAAIGTAAGGGGRGGGGPPGGIHAGGFLRGGKGRYGFATSPVGLNLGALAIGSFPAAATAVVNLTGAVQQLAQSGLLLPAVFATAAASIGTAALGFQGVGDAISTMWDAAASGDPKDLEKAAEALEGLTPSAKSAVTAVATLRPELMGLRDLVQENIFAGQDATIRDLADRTLPTLRKGLGETSTAWNKTFTELGRVGGLDSTQSFLDKIFGNTAEAQTRANAAIGPLIHGLGTLTAEGTDFLPRLSDGLTGLTTRFDQFITKAAGDGRLDKWINEGIEAVGDLGETFLNIGKIITDLTGAAGGDRGLLQWLRDSTTQLHEFLSSAEGQEKLGNFFREGREQIAKWIPVLRELWDIILQVYEASKTWTSFLLPILTQILAAINAIPGGLEALVVGFLAFKTISPFVNILGGLTGLNNQITTTARNADGLRGKLSGALGPGGAGRNLAGILGPGLLFGGAAAVAQGEGLGGLAAIGGGALTGFAVGGPWGALAGGFIGAVTAMTTTLITENKRISDAAIEAARPELGPAEVPAIVGPQVGGPAVAPPPIGNLPPTVTTGPGKGIFAIPGTPGPPVIDPGLIAADRLRASLADTRNEIGGVLKDLGVLGNEVRTLPGGFIEIDANTPEVIAALEALGLKVTRLPTGKLLIRVAYTDARGNEIDPGRLGIGGFAGVSAPTIGSAGGGVIPGFSPGVDDVLWPLSGGEGIVIPEAMRALGGSWLYGINSRFRAGLSRKGYADGGVHLGTGLPPGAGDPVLDLLTQIRDLLAGKGGVGTPLVDTAQATGQLATATGEAGAQLGPFGTPIKPRNIGYEMAAGAISALGGDPEKFLGQNPADLIAGAPGLAGGVPGVARAVDLSGTAAALAAFATTGDLSGVPGMDANDPVIKAIVAARNKKRGGLDDTAIADLVAQVVGGGGYTGTLDPSNTALITALQTFREKQLKGTGVPTGPGGAVPVTFGGPQGSKAGLQPLASQLWDVIAQQFPQVREIGGVRADPLPDHPSGRALDIMVGQNQALGDQINTFIRQNATQLGIDSTIWRDTWMDFAGNASTVPGHMDHIHAKVAEGMAGLPGGFAGLMPTAPGLPGANLATSGAPIPVWVVNLGGAGGLPGAPGGVGGFPGLPGQPGQPLPPGVQPILDAATSAAGGAVGDVASDVLTAIGNVGLEPWVKRQPNAELNKLVEQRNPLAFAAAAGFNVQDFTRQGGQGLPVEQNQQAFDASGRLFSDTGALIERTFTDLTAQINAMREQLLDVLNQVRQRLTNEVLVPIVRQAVQEAFNGIKDSVITQFGTKTGSAAAGPIADAVRSSIPDNPGGAAAGALGGITEGFFATGGGITGGTPGKDSVPILAQQGEWVSDVDFVRSMGGFAGMARFTDAVRRNGGVRGYATGGGVIGNATVGAEFFGVSQIPIIGAIVNLLIRVLLGVLGVQIEVRDTLNELSQEMRAFRGEFQRFDALGRLINDTSGLIDRSLSSEQAVADERIRILKIVIQALVKYMIEKVIVPIAKAVANAAISAGAGAAGGALNTVAPGAGGIVSALISSGGSAGVDILGEIGTDFGVNLSEVLIDMFAEGGQSLFPDLVTGLFGGNLLAGLFDPIGGGFGDLLGGVLQGLALDAFSGAFNQVLGSFLGGFGGAAGGGIFGAFASIFTTLLGGASLGGGFGGLGGGLFDEGGMAVGKGLITKAIDAPELVLSPKDTDLLPRLVRAMERDGLGARNTRTVHVSQHISGQNAPRQAADNLLALIDG